MWFLKQDYFANVYNLIENRQIDGKIPEQVSKGVGTLYMPHILIFYWFEPVLYFDPVSKLPETTENPRYFDCFTDTVVNALTFDILKNNSTTVHYSVT
jgi:hypothetical protein